jgi:predicted metal-dependent hydrolase
MQVIVHELLYLKVPNHGKLLQALLRAYLSGDELAGRFNHTQERIR